MILQTAIFPNYEMGAPDTLYYRTDDLAWSPRIENGKVSRLLGMQRGASVIFDTFYGAFSLRAWKSGGSLTSVTLRIEAAGHLQIRLWYWNGEAPPTKLDARDFEPGDERQSLDVAVELTADEGIIYPEIVDLQGGSQLFSVSYHAPRPDKSIHLAVVIPTFRREQYAKRTIRLLERYVLARASAPVDIYVVDNGGTLNEPSVNSALHCLKNRNYGGAGGFARGVLEALDKNPSTSHILFCDDDILLEPEALLRLISLLHYIPPSSIVPGGMMEMTNRGRLHEIGANVHGLKFGGNKHSLDLTQPAAVIDYTVPELSTFYGWWFVCYPATVLRTNLPFPAFVGFDDVELGKRLQSACTPIYLNGIAVWHDEFQRKDVNWRWYYHARNGIATHFIHSSSRNVTRHFFSQTLTSLLTYRYERAVFMIRGAEDALRGPVFLETLEADKFHERLTATQQQRMLDVRPIFSRRRFKKRVNHKTLRRNLSRLTLSGHLLPSFLFRKSDDPSSPAWAFEPLHSERLEAIFGRSTVVYMDPASGAGLICHIDRQKFFRLFCQLIWVVLKLSLRHSRLKSEWGSCLERVATAEYWKKHLTSVRD